MSGEKKPQKPKPVADLLQNLFENAQSPLSAGYQRWKLESRWEDIVGPTIGKNSRPVFYDNGTLLVEVSSAAWLNEIRFFSGDIIKKVNKHMGQTWVTKIRYLHQ